MEDVKAEELTPEMRELLDRAAALVEHAITTHSLACRCFICWEFASGENAEDGFMRATMAVVLHSEDDRTKAVQ